MNTYEYLLHLQHSLENAKRNVAEDYRKVKANIEQDASDDAFRKMNILMIRYQEYTDLYNKTENQISQMEL